MYDFSLLFLLSFSFIFHVICEDSSPSYACINQGHLALYNALVLGYIIPLVNYSLKSWNWLHCSLQDIGFIAIAHLTIYWVYFITIICYWIVQWIHILVGGIGLILSILSSAGSTHHRMWLLSSTQIPTTLGHKLLICKIYYCCDNC